MDANTPINLSEIGRCAVSALVRLSAGKAIAKQPPAGSPLEDTVEDTVELSPAGISLSLADDQSSAQIARIGELRAKIEAGTLLTPERMDGTAKRILEILD